MEQDEGSGGGGGGGGGALGHRRLSDCLDFFISRHSHFMAAPSTEVVAEMGGSKLVAMATERCQ